MPRTLPEPADNTPAFTAPRYIAVEGPIRVGKSTLTRFLAERMHARRVIDCEDNPFLSDFYLEKPGAAFRAQMYFLKERHHRLREVFMDANDDDAIGAAGGPSRSEGARARAKNPDISGHATAGEAAAANSAAHAGPAVISDFLFEKDKLFAYLNLDNEELKLYERYFQPFFASLRPPDLVIYLQATPEVLRERIAKKAAPGESRISGEYIDGVVRAYEHFFFRYSAANLLVVNTSEIDFVSRNADLQQLLRRLDQPVKGTQYFLPLG